jgi:hypothetical protein
MKKLIILIFGALIIQSCAFTRQPNKYPLIVTGVYQSSEPGYDIYVIKDSNPSTSGWGNAAMYIELKDKSHKFQIGDTIIFNKK